MRGGVVRHAAPDRVPCAAIEDEIVAQSQDLAVTVKADLDLVQLVARMGRALEVLLAVLDPAHRPAEPARQKRDYQILGVDVTLEPEPATNVERQTPHTRFRQAQDRGNLPAHPMHDLGRRPDRY